MLNNKPLITTYYALIVCFLAFQAVLTVFHGSQIVGHGKTVSQLDREKQQLMAKSYQLKQTLAVNNSLLHITASPVYNQFQPISGVLKIDQHQTVASR